MNSTLKKFVHTGFTLVELLIVVVILSILAAIVIPQFSSTTNDAREAALDVNLSAIRAAMELYRAQHGVYPGVTAATVGVACTGSAGTGLVNTAQAFADQLLLASDAAGHTCSLGSTPAYKFGPYLRKGIPADPNGTGGNLAGATVSGIVTVVTPTGVPIVPTTSPGGWIFDSVSGQVVMNSIGTDSRGAAYYLR